MPDRPVWMSPHCRDRESCFDHGRCMYVGCPAFGPDTSDIPEVGKEWFEKAKLREPRDSTPQELEISRLYLEHDQLTTLLLNLLVAMANADEALEHRSIIKAQRWLHSGRAAAEATMVGMLKRREEDKDNG